MKNHLSLPRAATNFGSLLLSISGDTATCTGITSDVSPSTAMKRLPSVGSARTKCVSGSLGASGIGLQSNSSIVTSFSRSAFVTLGNIECPPAAHGCSPKLLVVDSAHLPLESQGLRVQAPERVAPVPNPEPSPFWK